MFQRLETLSREVRSTNPYWDYYCDKYRMPNGNVGEYHYVHSKGSVFVVPQLADDLFVLVRQVRYLNQRVSVEFPGGGVEPQLSRPLNAARELAEEAGLRAGDLRTLGEFNPYNGVTNEICTVFLARELQAEEREHDESEEFDIVHWSGARIDEAIRSGELWDGMTLAAWSLYKTCAP